MSISTINLDVQIKVTVIGKVKEFDRGKAKKDYGSMWLIDNNK